MRTPRVSDVSGTILIIGCLLWPSAAAAAVQLQGFVFDAGRLGNPDAGIRWVRVTMEPCPREQPCETLTDGEGRYAFEGLREGAEVTVVHDHQGYFQRNTRVETKLVEGLEPLRVPMRRRTADRVYLVSLAAGLADLTEEEGLEVDKAKGLIEGLEGPDVKFIMDQFETYREQPESRNLLLEEVRTGKYFEKSSAVDLESSAASGFAKGVPLKPEPDGEAKSPPRSQPPKR